jgi:hypothetical protein
MRKISLFKQEFSRKLGLNQAIFSDPGPLNMWNDLHQGGFCQYCYLENTNSGWSTICFCFQDDYSEQVIKLVNEIFESINEEVLEGDLLKRVKDNPLKDNQPIIIGKEDPDNGLNYFILAFSKLVNFDLPQSQLGTNFLILNIENEN